MSEFRRRLLQIVTEAWEALSAWFRNEGWYRSEPW